jgi:hypothetical protein
MIYRQAVAAIPITTLVTIFFSNSIFTIASKSTFIKAEYITSLWHR